MFKTIFYREVLDNFLTRRFYTVLILCLIIIPLGIYISTKDYQSRLQSYQESIRLYDESHKTTQDTSIRGAEGYRPPSSLSFLSLGLEIILPNVAESQTRKAGSEIELGLNNNQSTDNLYSTLHGPLDIVFIVSVVMTFFAIVFAYGSISGEREQGTLKQILSNSVSRSQIILAKLCANYLVLVMPFLISLMISLLIFHEDSQLLLGRNGAWSHIFFGIVFSLLIIGAFFNLGVMISALTKHAVSTIVILLLCWVFLYGIYPRLSVLLSELIYPVKSQQLISQEKKQIRMENEKELETQVNKLVDSEQYSPEKQEAMREDYRSRLTNRLIKYDQEIWNKRNTQMMIMTNLSRLSPVSCFVRPLAEISLTGWLQYQEFTAGVSRFQQELNKQIIAKEKVEEHKDGTVSIRGLSSSADVPKFNILSVSNDVLINNILTDLILLIIYNLLFFTGAFVFFLKYDPR